MLPQHCSGMDLSVTNGGGPGTNRPARNLLLLGDGKKKKSNGNAKTRSLVSQMTSRGGGAVDRGMRRHGCRYIWPENVVVQMRLANDVDMRKISARRHNAYIPHRFETFTVRLCDQINTTILLFRTGRAVIVGTRAPEYTVQGAHRMRLELESLGTPAAFEELKLVNQVYHTRLRINTGINLGQMLVENMDKTVWVPDMFPGLKYIYDEMNVKMRMFDTKSLVVMGSKNAWEIEEVFDKADAIASQYPDGELPPSSERYRYREEQKRVACSSIAASEMVVSFRGHEDDGPKQ